VSLNHSEQNAKPGHSQRIQYNCNICCQWNDTNSEFKGINHSIRRKHELNLKFKSRMLC
jgi:hypothetical protein